MEQITNRKGVSSIAAERTPAEAEAPRSPETMIDLDAASHDGRRTYKGKFRYKVPTMGDRVDIGVMQARYQQQLSVVGMSYAVSEALAYLHVTIKVDKDTPQWWKDSNGGIDLYDFQPLLTLYAKARAYEATFLGRRDEPAGDEGTLGEGAAVDAGGDVEQHVQAPAQRRQVLASFGPRGSGAGADASGDGDPEAGSGG